MLTTLAATVRVLSEKLAQLEAGNSCPGDWVRLDVAVTRAALIARHQFGDCPDDEHVDCDELGELIGKDPRFATCVASKLYTYALGRDIEAYDAASLTKLQAAWTGRGMTIRNLMKEVVLSNAFRFRRGEAQ